jgi:hypothetical protein
MHLISALRQRITMADIVVWAIGLSLQSSLFGTISTSNQNTPGVPGGPSPSRSGLGGV